MNAESEYSLEKQQVFLEMMLQDAETFVQLQNIFNSENFDRSLRSAAEFINNHYNNYKSLPKVEQVNADTGSSLRDLTGIVTGQFDWLLDEFEGFTRRQELERAIYKSVSLLDKGDFTPVEKMVKDAVQISLTKDLGTDYFADPRGRLDKLFNGTKVESTGWPSLDYALYGGFARGELNIFAGGSGSGKSLFMMNLSVNWLMRGLNGCYLSLELYEDMCAKRIDSMITNIASKDIIRQMDDVEMKVKMVQKKSGNFQIKYMPAQSNVNDIRAYIKALEVKNGHKIDFLCVDYLDLLMPVSAKVSPNDLFVKDKYVSEELRNLAKELDVLFVTASQLNRSAVEEIEFDHSHISGGISKINTADNLFGIFTSRAMRERNQYQLQLMKTRSSNGVGKKVDLEFNPESLRITDNGEGAQQSNNSGQKTSNIFQSIKNKALSSPSPSEEVGKIDTEVNSAKLKQMLGKIKTGSIDGSDAPF